MLIRTEELLPDVAIPHQRQVYNGLDCCLTFDIFEELAALAPRDAIYNYELAMQAPALEMMLRGFLIDQTERHSAMGRLRQEIVRLDEQLQRLAHAVWAKPLNPRSPKRLCEFFYNCMRLPEVWTRKKGEAKLSMDRETLEKLELYLHARPIISHILAIRERAKLLEVLETEIDADGRMRTSYNIAGTETWRWSSSQNAYWTGTNLQNITPELRRMFIADPGWKLCGIDLEQAESREVAWLCGTLFGDWSYMDACTSGDLHTTVCRMAWPGAGWPSDAVGCRALADASYYRHLSRRDLAKKLGHGSNYFGQPPTMARHAKLPVPVVSEFQQQYFRSFPGIPRWHRYTAQCLQQGRAVTNVFGFTRHFFGRPNDDATLREAIAFSPQSATGIRLNLALYRVWQELGRKIRLIAQVHDALYLLYREADEAQVVPQVLALIDMPIRDPVSGRVYTVPGEAKVGWNWAGYASEADVAAGRAKRVNPEGLKKFKPGTPDTRKRAEGLNRIL